LLLSFHHVSALLAGRLRPKRRAATPSEIKRTAPPAHKLLDGISVVIPSRNGRHLLAPQLPGLVRELTNFSHEIIVVDNGSDDRTADWLRTAFPRVLTEASEEPLSFAHAVNRGIARSHCTHICLLNNDMLVSPGFFAQLGLAFERNPGLFCATAQIRFPEGMRREETGKAVLVNTGPRDFPVRCEEPADGEDGTWVLYGSGGCSIYDAAKLRELGALDEAYSPAYVEDLDLGYRAWQRGWPSVYVAGAEVEHRHRATTSRYFTPEQLEEVMEVNYLKFLTRAISDRKIFARLWSHAIERLWLMADTNRPARHALRVAAALAIGGGPLEASEEDESMFLALTDGSVAVFPGTGRAAQKPGMMIARPLVTNAPRAGDAGQILVTLDTELRTPPPEILSLYAEVVLVRKRTGERQHPNPAFRGALRQTMRKWQLTKVRMETRMMEDYVPDCAPAEFIIT
jgi:GT2 family glycosyltransferase